jgi:hypothetical protein
MRRTEAHPDPAVAEGPRRSVHSRVGFRLVALPGIPYDVAHVQRTCARVEVDALEKRRADGTALTGTFGHKETTVDPAGLGNQFGQLLKPAWASVDLPRRRYLAR